MTAHDDTHLWPPEALEALHSWAAERKRLEAENARLRAALETIAHDHAQHLVLLGMPQLERVSWHGSRVLGWAQGIAREALGQPQNEYTEHFSAVRDAAHGMPGASNGSEEKTNG